MASIPGGTLVGDIAEYQCDDGFLPIGSTARICTQIDETVSLWSGSEPTCGEIKQDILFLLYSGTFLLRKPPRTLPESEVAMNKTLSRIVYPP